MGTSDIRKEETKENEEDTAVKLLSSQISSYFDQVVERYYRLIVVVVPATRSQTINFCQVAESTNSRYVNINLELSGRLLELRQLHRATQVQQLLAEIIGNTNNGAVFLDRLEILFDESLKLKPLERLQKLARDKPGTACAKGDRTIVAVWNGNIENNSLIYAKSGHPEYCRCPTDDCIVINL
ncbi:BREX-3 system P-loop-containing protein BrxF [Scytonema sp. UIC 10036]|uniref:BREX-3 system P-loop-containing protein BrxF n=1 Tax=Scytonema sp. UIC 10036 TaxID=2304196 RepID=UPI0012DA1EB9|nr:BREX-3 system P-loop-containing protein BrxF [Scytonema sp. UIC 10036]MUG91474.1 BREX-3 system P-loop-containing protein BrxF [Scytonema sp. UIC 10036]